MGRALATVAQDRAGVEREYHILCGKVHTFAWRTPDECRECGIRSVCRPIFWETRGG